ncbi:hypothetical protein H1S01_18175 [Heliobacterium chlorum]|uniref:Uncharacterized protein n=1 Tax=Heliobacterium chlorum TaxID=2698 RepID=A0ABR7T8N8_HELCL|nr:hypothetical protein [Heliobacterium chlorum]MBC9786385.1 hypothetical protein [Heliobacterium chlorum]
MTRPMLTIPKSKKQQKTEGIKNKISDYAARKAKGEKPSLDNITEKLDLIIELLLKD